MGWWLLRLSAKILTLLRLSVNFFQLRLAKKLKINFFCFKKLNFKGLVKKYGGGGGGRSRGGGGHEVLSLVQGVGRAIFSYP